MEGLKQAVAPLRTVVIGSGNVASALAPALEEAGVIEVAAVCSPTLEHAEELACKLRSAVAVNDVSQIPTAAQLYLVSVSDDALASVASKAPRVADAVWLHTSGGVDASVLSPLSPNYGVLYPLQTFSKGRHTEFDAIPVFVEGATPEALGVAELLGKALSDDVRTADGDTRRKLHAAAVFACNFTNHLYAIASDILRREAGADLTVLRPLLEETLAKALSMPPADAQTGPARRGDTRVMERHMALIQPDEARLYKILSDSIMKRYEQH